MRQYLQVVVLCSIISVQANLIRTVQVNTREFHQDKSLQFNLLLATNIS